jgi:hypothetical protein
MRSLKVSEEIADLVWSSFEAEGEQNMLTKNKSSRELRKLFDLSFLRRVGVRQPPQARMTPVGSSMLNGMKKKE